MMTHALILADVEGIAEIYNLANMEECSKMYTQEIETCVLVLLENGVDKITVCDVHDRGDQINPKIARKGMFEKGEVRLVSRVDGIPFDSKYDFAFLIGFHGMSDTPGILPHTLRFDFKEIAVVDQRSRINIPIGEVEIYTRWLGSYGIPVMLVAGDREATYEANCFNPYRQTCCIKSYFQTNHFNTISMHDKLSQSLLSSLKLEKSLCLTPDDGEILIEFHNPDITQALVDKGCCKEDDRILFSCCADLVNNLYPLVEILQELNQEMWASNVAFLQTIKTLAKPLKREDLENSEIGPLLNNNLLFIDASSREKIMSKIQSLV